MIPGMNLGFQIFALALYALALMRVVRLINADRITDRLRTYPGGKIAEHRAAMFEARAFGQTARAQEQERLVLRWDKVLYYVGCPWCVGMWLAILTAWVPLYFAHNPVVQYIVVALAVSHLVGVMARFANTEEIHVEPDDDDE